MIANPWKSLANLEITLVINNCLVSGSKFILLQFPVLGAHYGFLCCIKEIPVIREHQTGLSQRG